MKFGAIDIGTNAARLLVGEIEQKGGHSFIKKISHTRVPLRLGEDVFENGKISKKKVTDFVKTIKAFKLISEIYEVESIRAVATSAMREAFNSEEVLEIIKQECGIEIEIITGDEEANLLFETFLSLGFDTSMSFVLTDVGGGSTEISVFENGVRVASQSFEIGTIRILKNKLKEGILTEINDWIAIHANHLLRYKFFGTGGNINKIHKILNKEMFEVITLNKLDGLHNDLKDLSILQRIDKYQLKPDRADVIVPAIEIYSNLMTKFHCTEMYVPRVSLSDGVIYKMYLDAEKANLFMIN